MSFNGIAQTTKPYLSKKSELTETQLQTWWQLDYQKDTIPGISLQKAYDELVKNKEGEEVIVAVLDTKMDIYHEDLKNQIWLNSDEIGGNGIDDDQNGYVDDINGWDFLSNTNGEFSDYRKVEAARIVKKYQKLLSSPPESLSADFSNYILARKAQKNLLEKIQKSENYIKVTESWLKKTEIAHKKIASILRNDKYTVSHLDSILQIKNSSDTLINYYAKGLKYNIEHNQIPERYQKYLKEHYNDLVYAYNPNYHERRITRDNPEDLTDTLYGSPQVDGNAQSQHVTLVAGLIAADRTNKKGANGVLSQVRIMPVVMLAGGDEHDKDISLAIRYAVDNGAKVINMSWGKYFSLYEDWVNDAFKYAAAHDVLLVGAAGNEGKNADIEMHYTLDWKNGTEIVNNFIMVGATTYQADKNLVASFSNYGKEQVDIFAPGVEVYTTKAFSNKYDFIDGTSLASPIVAGVAALIRSYYPKLTAPEVKEILLKSGTSYNMDIEIEQEGGTKIKVPFSELSKSGKVVNAYNALLIAEKLSKKNKA